MFYKKKLEKIENRQATINYQIELLANNMSYLYERDCRMKKAYKKICKSLNELVVDFDSLLSSYDTEKLTQTSKKTFLEEAKNIKDRLNVLLIICEHRKDLQEE